MIMRERLNVHRLPATSTQNIGFCRKKGVHSWLAENDLKFQFHVRVYPSL